MKLILTKAQNLRHAINETFNQIKNQTGKTCIIVPDKLSVTLEKKLFEALNLESSFDIEVSTLTRFSQKILSELDVDYTPISKLGSIILIKKLLNENSSELKLFNSPSFSYNYSDALFKTLTQFKASKISSDDIVFEKPVSKQLENKLLDIKLILEKYEKEKAGLIDSCDRLNLLSANIHKSEIVKNTNFHFIGFSDFTTQGYYVIEQLMKYSPVVNVCCYDTKSSNKMLYSDEVYTHLLNLAYTLEIPFEIVDNPYLDDDLHNFLANNIFASTQNSIQLEENKITLFNGKNISEEIDFVLRTIRNNVLNGGNYYDFGIACFELEKYVDLFKSTCEKYELNYYIDTSSKLSDTLYFKFILNFIKLYADNFRLENIVEFINSPFVDFELNKKIALNAYLKEINFSGNLKYLFVSEDLKSEINFLKEFFNSFNLDKQITITNLKENILKLETVLDVENKLNNIINLSSDFYSKKILSQARSSFTGVLNEIDKFYADLKLEDLLDILESAGQEQKIMPIPQSIDCVQIIDANEILTDFDNLFIINCTRNNAPQITQDIGIILDSNINNLPFEKKLTPTIAHLNKMSKFKLFNGFQMFNKSLTITMSVFNDSQKSDLAKEIECKIKIGNQCILYLTAENYLQSYKALSKWDLIEFLSSNYSPENNKILKNYGITPYSTIEYLDNNTIPKINFTEISCSALENYFKCPMLYFFNNTLNLQEERQSGIAMVDVGNMLHELAQDFYKIANRHSLDIPSFCNNMLIKYMSEDKKLNSYINSPIHINLVKEGTRFLNHLIYLDENSKFNPTFFEYSFDSKFSKSIPLTNEVYLRGKIDRIDMFDNYVRIIDYKTGSVSATLKELYYGKKLQLFLYGKVAQNIFNKTLAGIFYLPVKNILSDESITPYKLTGFYQNNIELAEMFDKRIFTTLKSDILNLSINKDGNITTDARSNKVLLPTQFNNLLDYAVNISKNAINEIKQGYIAPNPIKYDEQTNSCTFCKYLPICRKNSMNINFRTIKDIKLNSFGGEQNG